MQRLIIYLLLFMAAEKAGAQPGHYSAEPAPFSSDQYDEYSPVFYRNGIVFCSNRPDDLFIKFLTKENKENFNIYFINPGDTITWEDAGIFDNNLVTRFNDGPVTFNPRKQIIYYSRNRNTETKMKDIANSENTLGLFSAKKQNGCWSDIRSFPYNSGDYHNTTPFYDTLNHRLYFASTMPGGYGGTDLYYSERKDSTWDEPVNLGPRINTEGNEMDPFISASGKLFFSSDGHEGLGGKDIFFTEKHNGKWIKPIHLKPPINSKDDDFALITDHEFQSGYFSSNRKGSDDIYRFHTDRPQFNDCDSLEENNYCYRFWDENQPEIDTLPARYEWKFSDGTTAKGLKVEHCFPGAGKYQVELNIVDELTDTIYYTQQDFEFEIRDAVQPFIRSRDTIVKNEEVEFDGLKSNLPDINIENYYWNFGDGTLAEGPKVHHTYEKEGTYKVVLGVTGTNDSTGAKEKHCVWKEIKVFKNHQALAIHQAGKRKDTYTPDENGEAYHSDDRNFEQAKVRSPIIFERFEEVTDRITGEMNNSHLGFKVTKRIECIFVNQ
ncbi:MAG: PKD domain-containing protein [Bacteroidota bacterium]